MVDVIGTAKVRAMPGAIKRLAATAGAKATAPARYTATPALMAQRSTPSRVFKGKHMPGHMGAARVTVQNLMHR